ncbi:MAG TPA: hypothetical protein VFX52_13745 [Nocardioidaceae bacterium]|nr:hypothetical protein [Nocardioidaceae bacterium]
MSGDLFLPARFNGPAASANGGFACGALAERVAEGSAGVAVEVTLRRPPPLDTPLSASIVDGLTLLRHGDATVAEARVVEEDLEAVEEVSPDQAARAMLDYPGLHAHPFPTCFACGPDRVEGDGLRIFPGPVGGVRSHVASVWVPQDGHAESGDLVDGVHRCGVATTWAALDCVGGWSEQIEGRPYVLGRMTARIDVLPVVGEPHVVVGRHLGREGRRSFTASTLYDADGRIVGCARHTWVAVDPSLFG